MTRLQLEHIIRAAAANADTDQIVVFGSQSLLASFPSAGRPKDIEFLSAMVACSMLDARLLRTRLESMPLPEPGRAACIQRLGRLFHPSAR
ncbi:MAG: hypothetical protein KGR46_02885 [Verrucomicrobia bacterium]|jgi:hypothetical protein|nr:hypothetical protein [Verrucomicrobiota bacterium]